MINGTKSDSLYNSVAIFGTSLMFLQSISQNLADTVVVKETRSFINVRGVDPVTSSHCASLVPPASKIIVLIPSINRKERHTEIASLPVLKCNTSTRNYIISEIPNDSTISLFGRKCKSQSPAKNNVMPEIMSLLN